MKIQKKKDGGSLKKQWRQRMTNHLKKNNYFALLFAVVVLCWIFVPGIKAHWELWNTSNIVYDDTRQYIPPFLSYIPDSTFKDDYINQYYLNAIIPLGYSKLFKIIAEHGDLSFWQNVLPYISYITMLISLALVALRLGGVTAFFCTLLLTLSSDAFFYLAMGGSNPRMFAYPVVALALLTLIYERPLLLACLTIFITALYPTVAVICGITLACWLLLLPKEYQGTVVNQCSYSRRLGLLSITAGLCALIVFPQLINGQSYGSRVLLEHLTAYPEAGSSGRYIYGDFPPYSFFWDWFIALTRITLISSGTPLILSASLYSINDNYFAVLLFAFIWIFIIGISILGTYLLPRQSPVFVRVYMMLAGITLITHTIAYVFAPYLYMPNRYLWYTVPIWIVLTFPLTLRLVLENTKLPSLIRRNSSNLTILVVLGIFLLIGTRGEGKFTHMVHLGKEEEPIINYIKNMQGDASYYVAGWPNGIINNVPFFAQKSALLTFETHQVLHLEYLKEMRKRMVALMDAYFAKDSTPLETLRDTYGVTHFIVEKKHFKDTPPTYFKPFDEEIPSRLAAVIENPYILSDSLKQKAAVYEDDVAVIYELSKLEE
ncbi:MAG: hypothetical protein H6908_05240 [Hyphomicrobiales bacterium]|nr:hypothetical protein [Hyphomicrobiales bacterium]